MRDVALSLHSPASERAAALLVACDHVPSMIGVLELTAGGTMIRHIHSNAAVAAYWGTTSAALENRLMTEVGTTSMMQSLWLEKLRECHAIRSLVRFEYDAPSSSPVIGTVRQWWKATVWPLPIPAGATEPRFAYLAENITSYRTTEADLHDSRRFLEQVARTTPNIWHVYDLELHRNIYANREIATVLGYRAAEIQQMGSDRLAALIHPDDLPRVQESFLQCRDHADGEVIEHEFRVRHKDGAYRWLAGGMVPFLRDETSGTVRQILLVARDITRRRETQEALARSESQLRLAIEGANIGTFIADLTTGVITISRHARRHLGLPEDRATLTTDEMATLVCPEDRADFAAAMEHALASHGEFNAEYRVTFPNGAPHWTGTRAQIVFDTAGAPQQMIGVCFDIEERKQAEAQRAAAAQRQERIALTLQNALLSVAPSESVESISAPGAVQVVEHDFAAFPGWQVATLYEPALEEAQVGGDFFDAFALPGDRTAFVVGDVAGKGLDAAVSVAEIKFGLRSFLRGISDDPASAMAFLNDRQIDSQILDGRSRERFIALTIAVADNATGVVRLACAGAEPPIRCPSGGAAGCPMEYGDLPLGALPHQTFATTTITLPPGDTLLLYTDGLTESRTPDGAELLGTCGLLRILAEVGTDDSSALCRRIATAVSTFSGNQARHDDTCLLAARRL